MTEQPVINQTKPWLAEIEMSPELAAELIKQQFPALNPINISLLGVGWDNTVYSVETADQELVFRFPRRKMALDLMQTEWKLLDSLAPLLPLNIPRPLYAGQASPDFKWPFAGYTLVPGQTACQANLDTAARIRLAPLLGQFLKTLHQLEIKRFKQLGAPADLMQKVDIEVRSPQTLERLKTATELGLIHNPKPFYDFLESLSAKTPADRPVCLVHGDLYIRHLVVDLNQHLTGVIDWGDAHLGDPATDLSVVYTVLPPEAHALFWEEYGAVDPLTLQLARFRALFHSLALLLYAQDTDDPDLMRESLKALFENGGWWVQRQQDLINTRLR